MLAHIGVPLPSPGTCQRWKVPDHRPGKPNVQPPQSRTHISKGTRQRSKPFSLLHPCQVLIPLPPQWKRKGYPSKIIDTAGEAVMGGPLKIDSIQNVITLRTDLRDAWDNYEFGVDPDVGSIVSYELLPNNCLHTQNDYRITAFTNGNADIDGLRLQLDHIQDPTTRPLDELFIDHFMQGIFKHMRGESEPAWTYEDYDNAFGEGSFNISNPKIWGTREGKERFELALTDRLLDHRVQQELDT